MNNTAIAPWPDFLGRPIHHGDRMEHTYGQGFVAVRLEGHADEGDAWRAIYDDATVSRLCLQIGDKGQARVVKAKGDAPATAPAEVTEDAARLDWIASQADEYTCTVVPGTRGTRFDGGYAVYGRDRAYGRGRTVREAIDAARQSGKGGA